MGFPNPIKIDKSSINFKPILNGVSLGNYKVQDHSSKDSFHFYEYAIQYDHSWKSFNK